MRFLTIIITSFSLALSMGCQSAEKMAAVPKADAPAVQRAASAAPAAMIEAPAAKKVAPEAEEAGAGGHEFNYSPFVLRLEGSHFDLVSFKDVGMHVGDEDAEIVYETIAESLAMSLAEDEGLGIQAEVAYDEGILDPKNHVACGATQLYVDVWRNAEAAKWGFSLWSGCSEDDKFAWKELEYESKDADPIEQIAPLTKSITHTLRKASEAECFQKAC